MSPNAGMCQYLVIPCFTFTMNLQVIEMNEVLKRESKRRRKREKKGKMTKLRAIPEEEDLNS